MRWIADFHIHSKFSRATSAEMDIPHLGAWARLKGIDLLGTGDFTHPQWLDELTALLAPVEYGLYERDGLFFMLTAEVSNIYFKAGRTRKVHTIIFAPDIRCVRQINAFLSAYGDLAADGRPIVSIDAREMVRRLDEINPDIFCVPAHVWTPHFSVFGAHSGFDSLEECFEEQTPKILALETGLSSDPPMNYRLSRLDRCALISNSDCHSPAKIGREANVFSRQIGYRQLREVLKRKDASIFRYTIEFFPEEGKYHWDGHRQCKMRLDPAEAKRLNNICPRCGRRVTVGVQHRVEDLADRPWGYVPAGVPGVRRVVPLDEIIAEAMGIGPQTVGVQRQYHKLVPALGTEFAILLDLSADEMSDHCPQRVIDGIMNMRAGAVKILPGYDGEYGTVSLFPDPRKKEVQQTFFNV